VTPALFVSHGAPTVALEEDEYTRALAAFGARLARPEAIVVVSAHWEARGPIRVNVVARPGLIYDFGGFPRALYEMEYPAPGAPALGDEALRLLGAAGLDARSAASRGWDHGVWVPLKRLFPEAAVPVLEVSLPVPRTPEMLFRAGQALGPLRSQGALILGSGGIVHNLGRLHWNQKEAPVDDWARAFDEWVAVRLEMRETDDLLRYEDHAPHADLAVPTSEHLDPLFFVLGATSDTARACPIFTGFHYGNLSMRTVAFAPSSQ
jgi:4,5-DOPA dioxygenase extradiol